MLRSLCLASLLALAACGGKSAPPAEPGPSAGSGSMAGSGAGSAVAPDQSPPTDDTRVCCESFGYGAQMAKCCETYAWTAPADCTTPAGMVGGGKQVVDGAKCGK